MNYYIRNRSWTHDNNTVCALVTGYLPSINCQRSVWGILIILILATVQVKSQASALHNLFPVLPEQVTYMQHQLSSHTNKPLMVKPSKNIKTAYLGIVYKIDNCSKTTSWEWKLPMNMTVKTKTGSYDIQGYCIYKIWSHIL